jgi:hypothetical protein
MECQHGSCTCQVTAADPYCGDFCREHGLMSQLGCGCGHPECQGTQTAMSEGL